MSAVLRLAPKLVEPEKVVIQCKPRWDRCDQENFVKSVSDWLKPFDSFHISNSKELDILYPLGHLCAVLKLATDVSIPNHKNSAKLKNRKHRPWSEKIHEAIKRSRLEWWEWRKAGSPRDLNNPYLTRMKEAKKCLRREQRREAASRRDEKIETIMNAEDDSRTFYGLVKAQRKSASSVTDCIIVEGKTCDTSQEICQGWATHFQSLASPLTSDDFDQEYKELVDQDIESINTICETKERKIDPVTEEEVQRALNKLKNNKAMDSMGLCSEHLKMGGQPVIGFLTGFLNSVIKAHAVSAVMKEGLLTPIYKKGDSTDPGNYRGITVTPVLLKVLEHILNFRHNRILEPTQSRLQKGFTKGCSSVNAALILTECINESVNNKEQLLFTTLDAKKAFDVVDHNSLLRRLYLDGIDGDDWLLIQDLYSDCSSRVKWAGLISDPVNLKQGVRQGGVLSTAHYKRYNNPLLLQLEERYTDVRIGSINIPHVTVADDLAVLARKYNEMQVILWDVENNTIRERYCVNPTKCSCLCFNPLRKQQTSDLSMAGENIPCEECTVHLGISRRVNGKVNIEEKINLGRKTAYSLMGAGFHSVNGLKTCLNGHVWSTFVVPRLVYGLEILSLKKNEIENLEKFQRKSLRQIQGLPDKTSNSITLALLGMLPLEAVIHKNSLNLFCNIVRNKHFIEFEIAERQLVTKSCEEKTWFNLIKLILEVYNLPSIFSLFDQQISKAEWKKIMDNAVHSQIEASWRADVTAKSSLKYVNPDSLKVGHAHPVWSTVRNTMSDNKRAQLKCKVLTGTYILQGNRAAFNQYTVDATCKLCLAAPETRLHFIANCSAYALEREVYVERLRNNPVLSDSLKDNLGDSDFLTQLTLDASVYVTQLEELEFLESSSREYIEQIHRKRIARLNHISQC
ncbi:MAG: reverse transcriptase family protein [Candidatus Thiodiazotropha sp.]